MRELLTEDPSPRFHLIPVVEDVDAQSEANKLQCGSHETQSESHACPFVRVPLNFIELLSLYFQLDFELVEQSL